LLAESNPAGASTAEANVVKIGALASLTGPSSDDNKEMINGMELFLDQVKHSVHGKKIQLIVEDDESNPPKGKIKFKKLAEQDKVAMVGGIYFSTVVNQIAALADQYKIPTVVAVAGADNLTQRNQHAWVIRSGPSASQRAMPMGDYAAKTLGYKKVITLGPDFLYGYELIGGFQKVFEDSGGKVVQRLWAGLEARDFESIFKEMHKDANALFVSVQGVSTAPFLRQYHLSGLKFPLIGSMNTFDEQNLGAAAEDAEGAISVGPYCSTLDLPATKKFVAAYQAKYHQTPGFYSAAGYTNAMWMYSALNSDKAALTDHDKLMAAAKAVKLPDSPMGPLKLDDHQSVVCNIYVRKLQKVNGTYVNKVIYTYPNVSQFWKWSAADYLKQPPFSRDFPAIK